MAKRIYTVQTNDTLSIIARDELGDISRWQEIAYINSIRAPYIIYPGQQILLPSDEPLVVEITEYGQAPPTQEASIVFNPATVALLVIGGALLLFGEKK